MFRLKMQYRTTEGYTHLLPYFTAQNLTTYCNLAKKKKKIWPKTWPDSNDIRRTIHALSLQEWQLETMKVYKDRCFGTFFSNFVQHVASATQVLLQ